MDVCKRLHRPSQKGLTAAFDCLGKGVRHSYWSRARETPVFSCTPSYSHPIIEHMLCSYSCRQRSLPSKGAEKSSIQVCGPSHGQTRRALPNSPAVIAEGVPSHRILEPLP